MRKFVSLVLASALVPFALAACGSSTAAPSETVSASSEPAPAAEEVAVETVNLDGTWKGGDPGFEFEAKIEGGTISMQIKMEDETKALYWQGTFVSDAEPGQVIVSDADTEALSKSLLGSQEATKEFTFEDDSISFDFGMMGVTKTVHLKK